MPLFYTNTEGGLFLPWPKDKPLPSKLRLELLKGEGGTQKIEGLDVHSLLHIDRWDTLNGSTPEIAGQMLNQWDRMTPCPRCHWPNPERDPCVILPTG